MSFASILHHHQRKARLVPTFAASSKLRTCWAALVPERWVSSLLTCRVCLKMTRTPWRGGYFQAHLPFRPVILRSDPAPKSGPQTWPKLINWWQKPYSNSELTVVIASFPHTCFPLVQSFGALNLLNTLARCRLIYIEVFSIAPAAWCLFDPPCGGKNNNRRMKSSKLSLHLTKSANGLPETPENLQGLGVLICHSLSRCPLGIDSSTLKGARLCQEKAWSDAISILLGTPRQILCLTAIQKKSCA